MGSIGVLQGCGKVLVVRAHGDNEWVDYDELQLAFNEIWIGRCGMHFVCPECSAEKIRVGTELIAKSSEATEHLIATTAQLQEVKDLCSQCYIRQLKTALQCMTDWCWWMSKERKYVHVHNAAGRSISHAKNAADALLKAYQLHKVLEEESKKK